MEPQNNQQTPPTATAPAPQATTPAPAPAPEAPAAPAAPVATAPAKAGSKLPMWLLVVLALVVIGGVAYFLMA